MNKKNLKLYQQLQQVYTNVIDMTTVDKFAAFKNALKDSPDYLKMLFSYTSKDGLSEPFYTLDALTVWASDHVFNEHSGYSSQQQSDVAKMMVSLESDGYYWAEIDVERAKVQSAFRPVTMGVLDASMEKVLTNMLLDSEVINTESLNDLELGLRAVVGKDRVILRNEHGSIDQNSERFIADVLNSVKRLASLRK